MMTDGLQVGRARLFHFELCLAVARVYVVELLFAGGAGVYLAFRIEVFVQVNDIIGTLPANPQTEMIECGGTVVRHVVRTAAEGAAPHEPEGAEVEIVAQAAGLIVDERMGRAGAVGTEVVVVGIDHPGIRLLGHLNKPLQHVIARLDGHGTGAEQHVVESSRKISGRTQPLRGAEGRSRLFDDAGFAAQVQAVLLQGTAESLGGAAVCIRKETTESWFRVHGSFLFMGVR